MNTPKSRSEFYTQAAAENLRIIEETARHSRKLEELISKLTEATHDLLAVLSIEIASERDAGMEGDL